MAHYEKVIARVFRESSHYELITFNY